MQLTVVKIGGNIVDDKTKLSSFLKDFASIPGYKILVHGGGKIATEIGKKLGIEPNYINGRRITDGDTLSLVTMVYGGLINKGLVAALQAYSCNAIGLTGADANILPAMKRGIADVDYGFVGDVDSSGINAAAISSFLQLGFVPVVAPLTHDTHGGMLNTNADTIAQEIAQAMARHIPVQLVYCFEKKGVLVDPADESSVIDNITQTDFDELKAKDVITGGMIPKLENAFLSVRKGVGKVIIGHADDLCAMIAGNGGTCIK